MRRFVVRKDQIRLSGLPRPRVSPKGIGPVLIRFRIISNEIIHLDNLAPETTQSPRSLPRLRAFRGEKDEFFAVLAIGGPHDSAALRLVKETAAFLRP